MNEHLIIYHDNFKELQTISRNMDNNRNFQFYKLSDAESDLIYKSISSIAPTILSALGSEKTTINKDAAWMAEFRKNSQNELHDHSGQSWKYLGILTLKIGEETEHLDIVNNNGRLEKIKFVPGEIIIIDRCMKHGLSTTNDNFTALMIPLSV